jgi:hypothetical protein
MAKYQDVVTYENGVKVTICAPRKPKRSERTFLNNKGSIANLGAKAAGLMASGIMKGKA